MHLTLDRATRNDAETIAFIGKQSFTDTFGPLFINKKDLTNYVEKTYSKQRVEFSLDNSNNIYFLGRVDNQAAGFAKLKINSSHPVIDKTKQCELQRIYVLKEFHGRGIAQRLITAIIEEAKIGGAQCLWLDVHIHNERAKKFYTKNGFLIAGDHRFTIGSQEFSFFVMQLDLTKNRYQENLQFQNTFTG